ncbi:hypothetical protein BB561_004227 [Smittium simulii]|uniref:Glycoside hydrolase family 19 catalytic domain-containing protein n=1 Tax=Smittium simulii TaxID=133385 RepID=A0A2T9YHE8_9FUNG|nr:hypothetical protein BB561_004227 [Smittium simulii]
MKVTFNNLKFIIYCMLLFNANCDIYRNKHHLAEYDRNRKLNKNNLKRSDKYTIPQKIDNAEVKTAKNLKGIYDQSYNLQENLENQASIDENDEEILENLNSKNQSESKNESSNSEESTEEDVEEDDDSTKEDLVDDSDSTEKDVEDDSDSTEEDVEDDSDSTEEDVEDDSDSTEEDVEDDNDSTEEDDNDISISSASSQLSCDLINQAISTAGYGDIGTDNCEHFISHLAECGINDNVVAAIALTNLAWESGGFLYNREIACEQVDCSTIYSTEKDVAGKDYGGRGFIQLTWSYNYESASYDLYGDDRLLQNPETVLETEVNWDTSFWYLNKYVLNSQEVLEGHFGASTNLINGALECRGGFQEKAKKRFALYQKILSVLSPNTIPNESGCYN